MLTSERGTLCHEFGRGAFKDDAAAIVTGAGAEVDDPVRMGHNGLVVLDDDDGLARLNQPVEQAEQLLDVREVQAGGRLVEDIDAPPFSPKSQTPA